MRDGATSARESARRRAAERDLGRLGVAMVPDGWRLSTVGKACTIRNDLRLPLSVETRSAMQGEYPYYGPTGVLDHLDNFRAEGEFALIGEDGDHFLDTKKSQTVRVSGRFNVNNHAHLIASGSSCSVDWFFQFFRHRGISHSLTRQGAGRYKLTKQALEKLPILLPPLPEQRKIAEILRTWDEALEMLISLRKAKELQYRAFARKFFEPCHPSFFGRPSTWREFELADIFSERSQAGEDRECLLSVTMSGGVIDRDDVGRKDTSTEDKSRYKLVLPGDIAYNTMRMWQGVSGLSTLRGIVSPAYTVVTPIEERISGRYAAHLFKSRRMVFDFERYSQGLASDTWNLKFPAFSKIKLWLPPVDDQEKQADLLDVMLCEQDVLRQQVEALTRQKRGLMQKLLTSEWPVQC